MIVSNAYTNKYLTTAQVTTYYIIQKKNKINIKSTGNLFRLSTKLRFVSSSTTDCLLCCKELGKRKRSTFFGIVGFSFLIWLFRLLIL